MRCWTRILCVFWLALVAGAENFLEALTRMKDGFDRATQRERDDVKALRRLAQDMKKLAGSVNEQDPMSRYFWRLRMDTVKRLRRWDLTVKYAWKAARNVHCQNAGDGCLDDVIHSGILAVYRQDADVAEAKRLFDFARGLPVAEGMAAFRKNLLTWPSHFQLTNTVVHSLPSKNFWDPADFPLALRLQQALPDILAELDFVLPALDAAPRRFEYIEKLGGEYKQRRNSDFLDNARELCDPEDASKPALALGLPCWEELMFYYAEKSGGKVGHWVDDHCHLAPKSCAALQEPGLIGDIGLNHTGVPGKAGFVMLHPNSRIAAHTGVHNARLTLHLGLRIPEGSYIEVNGERRSWKVGEVLILDDSFVHFVGNPSDEDRVILLAHVWHPSLVETRGGYNAGVTSGWAPRAERGSEL